MIESEIEFIHKQNLLKEAEQHIVDQMKQLVELGLNLTELNRALEPSRSFAEQIRIEIELFEQKRL